MKERVMRLLVALDDIREDLLGLSDDIWLEVDHNNSDELKKACEFKLKYNEKLRSFDQLAGELSELIKEQSDIDSEPKVIEEKQSPETSEGNTGKEAEGFLLDRSFTYTKPIGYIFEGKKYRGTLNWKPLYRSVCEQLAKKDKGMFGRLSENKKMITNRGNKMFSSNPSDLRGALKLPENIFAESNLSANQFRDNLKLLFSEFNLDKECFRVLLRYDPLKTTTNLNITLEDLGLA